MMNNYFDPVDVKIAQCAPHIALAAAKRQTFDDRIRRIVREELAARD